MEYTVRNKDEKNPLLENFYCEDCEHIKRNKGKKEWFCGLTNSIVLAYEKAPEWCPYRKN